MHTPNTLPHMGKQPQHALRLFAGLYTGFIVLASLYPFAWHSFSTVSLAFMNAPWPRFITRTDLTTNLFIYAPLGYAYALLLAPPGHRLRGMIFALFATSLLSLGCETLQGLLSTRFASNLDWLVNSLGAMLGALLALHHSRWQRAGRALSLWRQAWFFSNHASNLGLLLLGAWLISQFALVPFPGLGWLNLHLRPIDTPLAGMGAINPGWFVALFLELVAVGSFAACLLRPGRYVAGLALLALLAFLSKLFVATLLLKLTVVGGILSLETLAAFVLALWVLLLPSVSRRRRGTAFLALVGCLATRFSLSDSWLPGVSALNVMGAAKYVGTLWPLLALSWLSWLEWSSRVPPTPAARQKQSGWGRSKR